MAKKTRRQEEPIGKILLDRTENRMEEFAEDLGRLLGSAQARAQNWLDQRQQVAQTLEGIRDTAARLLTDLGEQAEAAMRRGRPVAAAARRAAAAGQRAGRKRRRMSPEARARIAAAQRKRWAAVRRAKKTQAKN